MPKTVVNIAVLVKKNSRRQSLCYQMKKKTACDEKKAYALRRPLGKLGKTAISNQQSGFGGVQHAVKFLGNLSGDRLAGQAEDDNADKGQEEAWHQGIQAGGGPQCLPTK